jgi:hypothetical protein
MERSTEVAVRRYIVYFWYVAKHKWFVLLAGLRIGAPLWLLLIHDLSKFLPSEFFPYARHFYNPDGSKKKPSKDYLSARSAAFEYARLKHKHRNPHHWEHWLRMGEHGVVDPLPHASISLRWSRIGWGLDAPLQVSGMLLIGT